ncbi:hypothetical protein LEP1GSC036_2503 [Leptospira weilii str. 2006001853]|uniref:Uncharacterized protein n=1 Tax=Leptospira weilii str. 2006001853 TaxID=1001589 RepID=A0A828YZL2_9LEPT|nr:hypothetical protein LEP1GSC036_2503 [Leptospira weilii str. 2006001853]
MFLNGPEIHKLLLEITALFEDMKSKFISLRTKSNILRKLLN